MGRPTREPDWLGDREMVMYRDRGWSWDALAAYFGVTARTCKRRYERVKEWDEARREEADA